MMFIVRLQDGRGKLKLALAAEQELRASYPPVYRPKRTLGGSRGLAFLEVEHTGQRRQDALDLRLGANASETERGQSLREFSRRRELRVPLVGVDQHVRRLGENDAEPLASNATAIARAEAEVTRLQDERSDLVRAAWRRSRKSVGPAELEVIADRTAKIEAQPAGSLLMSDTERARLQKDTELLTGSGSRT